MKKELYRAVIASECNPDNEAKYNKWYEKHVTMVFELKSMKRTSRYHCYKQVNPNDAYAKYLAFYEFESKDAVDFFPKSPEFIAAGQNYEEEGKYLTINKWAGWYECLNSLERKSGSNPVLWIIGFECKPGDEAKFTQNIGRYIKALFEFKDLIRTSCYLCYHQIGTDKCAKYLAFFEFETKEVLKAFSNSAIYTAANAEFKKTSAKECEAVWQGWYERIKLLER